MKILLINLRTQIIRVVIQNRKFVWYKIQIQKNIIWKIP